MKLLNEYLDSSWYLTEYTTDDASSHFVKIHTKLMVFIEFYEIALSSSHAASHINQTVSFI